MAAFDCAAVAVAIAGFSASVRRSQNSAREIVVGAGRMKGV